MDAYRTTPSTTVPLYRVHGGTPTRTRVRLQYYPYITPPPGTSSFAYIAFVDRHGEVHDESQDVIVHFVYEYRLLMLQSMFL